MKRGEMRSKITPKDGRGNLFSRPALPDWKTMGEPSEKNLDPHIKKNHFPHSQLATQDIVLCDQEAALKAKLCESDKKTADLQELPPKSSQDRRFNNIIQRGRYDVRRIALRPDQVLLSQRSLAFHDNGIELLLCQEEYRRKWLEE
jgi:hypothetical protein